MSADRHADNLRRLARLRGMVEEATNPGRWHWSGNMDYNEPQLCTWVPGEGRTSVLAVLQKGRRAKLVFNNRGWLVNASKLAVYEVAPSAERRDDPRVYRADIIGIRHPDATLIPLAVNALPAVLDDIEARLANHRAVPNPFAGVAAPGFPVDTAAGERCHKGGDAWPCADYLAAEALLKAMGGE